MVVDLAIVLSVVFLAYFHIADAAVWSLFSVMVGARFGIAVSKAGQRSDGTSMRPPTSGPRY
jgi:hypothetical protein